MAKNDYPLTTDVAKDLVLPSHKGILHEACGSRSGGESSEFSGTSLILGAGVFCPYLGDMLTGAGTPGL